MLNDKPKQLTFFNFPKPKENEKNTKVFLLFRKTIPEIPSTTYGTFSIYKYPAKFIPQVIAYVLKNYAKPGMKIFDPFAGGGTVGIVSKLYGYDYELWDLNPILKIIHDTAIMKNPKINPAELIKEIKNSKNEFIPNWSNLNYWFPQEFLPMLSKTWGFVHSTEENVKHILLIPLLNVTKYFSYADEKVHKLYKSKYSKKKIEELLKSNYEALFYAKLEKEIHKLLHKIWEYNRLNPKEVVYEIKAGIDTLEMKLENDVNILITSPPYLQAQEYIRSTKLELFWLGFDENYIRELSKKELPYRPVKEIKIYSEKYHELRGKIQEEHLKLLYDRYFFSILWALTNLSERVTDYMFIFVGPAKIRTTPIPIDEIIIEHLKFFGWEHEITFVDKIVSRVMFETKINPASKENDSRIKTEHLVVLKRKK
ncbi:D12 class N6 adenine-specific DNA methyltransferase [Candidatus Thermokryptus mobilis]|uniref:site-specific DNA-methyltransferase (cytosine-N(4)-specific) n=1 Tax=Candidatus Thermokryptus mobilis TaxID=1643428 RepID=A0A0S4NGM0_9BACT|nr:DNA adenine methylase [Candidatus Thermokryptus mobilis]CUU09263.1 D12 class N6 adenine-specific DNA methyltransferase [Candidatus Thermokryptus mobilis]